MCGTVGALGHAKGNETSQRVVYGEADVRRVLLKPLDVHHELLTDLVRQAGRLLAVGPQEEIQDRALRDPTTRNELIRQAWSIELRCSSVYLFEFLQL